MLIERHFWSFILSLIYILISNVAYTIYTLWQGHVNLRIYHTFLFGQFWTLHVNICKLQPEVNGNCIFFYLMHMHRAKIYHKILWLNSSLIWIGSERQSFPMAIAVVYGYQYLEEPGPGVGLYNKGVKWALEFMFWAFLEFWADSLDSDSGVKDGGSGVSEREGADDTNWLWRWLGAEEPRVLVSTPLNTTADVTLAWRHTQLIAPSVASLSISATICTIHKYVLFLHLV